MYSDARKLPRFRPTIARRDGRGYQFAAFHPPEDRIDRQLKMGVAILCASFRGRERGIHYILTSRRRLNRGPRAVAGASSPISGRYLQTPLRRLNMKCRNRRALTKMAIWVGFPGARQGQVVSATHSPVSRLAHVLFADVARLSPDSAPLYCPCVSDEIIYVDRT